MLIIGCGGLAKDLHASMSYDNCAENLFFYDDISQNSPDLYYSKYPILKTELEAKRHFQQNGPEFLIAIGDPKTRKKIETKFENLGGIHSNFISKKAFIGPFSKISDKGVIIMHAADISNDVTIGQGCLIYFNAHIGHDCSIGNYSFISGATNMSRLKIGEYCEIGMGAILKPRITLGSHVKVGAGSFVTKNFDDYSNVVGFPARKIGQNK